MMRSLTIPPIFTLLLTLGSACSHPELNPTPPTSEAAMLSDAIELTHGFQRAGEAYFAANPELRVTDVADRVADLIEERWAQGRADLMRPD